MNETIYLGSSPTDEPCAQLGEPGYAERAHAEIRAYRNQIRRENPGLETKGVSLRVRANNHDAGVYYELVALASEYDESAVRAAYRLEERVPDKWDAEALAELVR